MTIEYALFKKVHAQGKAPRKGRPHDAAYDLSTSHAAVVRPSEVCKLHTGIAVDIPFGHVGKIEGRSSLAVKGLGVLAGVIDPGYQGELVVVAVNHSSADIHLQAGDKIAQLLVHRVEPGIEWVEVPEFEAASERGSAGFGSTGR